MGVMRYRLRCRNNFDRVRAEIEVIERRIVEAMQAATKDATEVLRSEVVSTVEAKTDMSRAVAEAITESEFVSTPTGGRGEVSFKKPPQFFYPKEKRALAFTINGQKVIRRRVRGSRPYKLIRTGGQNAPDAMRRSYREGLVRMVR